LLYIDWKDAEASWRLWLLASGLRDIDAIRGPRFTMENMAVQAAIDGHGMALVGDMRVADALAAGRLVRPFDPNLSTPLTFSYYLLSARKTVPGSLRSRPSATGCSKRCAPCVRRWARRDGACRLAGLRAGPGFAAVANPWRDSVAGIHNGG
jgi:hypothetical protein